MSKTATTQKLVKLFTIVALTVFAVSVLFWSATAFASIAQPWNIEVDIVYGDYSWHYSLSSNISALNNTQKSARGVYRGYNGKKAIVQQLLQEGYTQQQAYSYVLCGMRDLVKDICGKVNQKAVDAIAKFTPNNAQKFVYVEGKDGIAVDEAALYRQILFSCKTYARKVNVPCTTLKATTVSQLKRDRQVLGTFTTTFPNSTANRCHNIQLAVSSIKGKVLGVGQSFSFNQVVGDRTVARGYKNAKVIANGNYVEGVGGGVCQVSTTLYNAVLLSGLTVNKVYAHSLVPSYVKAGFDAMVSYPACDLVFTNNTDSTVYIDGYVKDKTVVFTLFGRAQPDVKRTRESVELMRVPYTQKNIVDNAKYPDLIYTDQSKVIVNGSDMVKSSAYLCIYKGGVLAERRLLRTVTYKMVEKVVAHGDKMRPQSNDNGTMSDTDNMQTTN